MKKVLKIAGKVVLWTFVVIVVVVLALPLWIGPVAKGVANWQAPKITGCKFNLGKFGLNQYVGTLAVGDMQLANPPECGEGNCVELGNFDVDVEMTTLMSKKVHVTLVSLDGLVVSTDLTASNFRKILANVKGEPKETKEEEPKGSMLSRLDEGEEKVEKELEEAPASEGKRFIIDKLVLKNIKVNYGVMPIVIPTIEREGIGADEPDGASLAEVVSSVYKEVMECITGALGAVGDVGKLAVGLVGDGASKVAGVIGDGAGKAADAISGGAGAVADGAGAVVEGAGAAAGKAADAIGDGAGAVAEGAGKAIGAIGEGAGSVVEGAGAVAGKAVGAIGDGAGAVVGGAGKAVGAIGDGAGKAAGAIGDGAGKAVDAIKGIFKSE